MHVSFLISHAVLWLLCDSEDTEPSRVSTKPTHSDATPKAVVGPSKDKHGIWELNDDLFDSFLDAHPRVAVMFSDDSLFSYAGKYYFDRAAHILRDLRNSDTEFAVFDGGFGGNSNTLTFPSTLDFCSFFFAEIHSLFLNANVLLCWR